MGNSTRLSSTRGCSLFGPRDIVPNYQRGRFNAPLAFFIRAEGPGTRHNARVKVNANYNLGYDRTANFSIQLFPNPGVVSGHAVGSAKQSDVDGMIAWLDTNRDTVAAFFTGTITAQEFDVALAANPYPSVQL
jgi:hypothetical protein